LKEGSESQVFGYSEEGARIPGVKQRFMAKLRCGTALAGGPELMHDNNTMPGLGLQAVGRAAAWLPLG